MWPAFTLPSHGNVDRTPASFIVEEIASPETLLPTHQLLPLDHPFHKDLPLHLAFHAYYNPKTHNVGYFALAVPDETEVDDAGNPVGELTPEVIAVVLVSRLAHRKDGEHLQWTLSDGQTGRMRVCFGLGAAEGATGVRVTGRDFLCAYDPARPGSSVSIGRFNSKESTLACFVRYRLQMGGSANEPTSWEDGLLTCAHDMAFSKPSYPTKLDKDILQPVMDPATRGVTAGEHFRRQYGSVQSPATATHKVLMDRNLAQDVNRDLGDIVTAGYSHFKGKHSEAHAIDVALSRRTRPLNRFDITSNSVTIDAFDLPVGERRARTSTDRYFLLPLQPPVRDLNEYAESKPLLCKAGISSGLTSGTSCILQQVTWDTHTSHDWVLETAGLAGDSGSPVHDTKGGFIGMVIAVVHGLGLVFTPWEVLEVFSKKSTRLISR